MANYIIDGTLLTNIAAAIRSKKGVSNTYTPAQMAAAINGLSIKKTEVSAGVSTTSFSADKVTVTLTRSLDALKSVPLNIREVKDIKITLESSTTIAIEPVSGSFAGSPPSIDNQLMIKGYVFSIQ